MDPQVIYRDRLPDNTLLLVRELRYEHPLPGLRSLWYNGYVGIPSHPLLEALTYEYDNTNLPSALYDTLHDIHGGCTFLLSNNKSCLTLINSEPGRKHVGRDPSYTPPFDTTHVWFGFDTLHSGDTHTDTETIALTRDWATRISTHLRDHPLPS